MEENVITTPIGNLILDTFLIDENSIEASFILDRLTDEHMKIFMEQVPESIKRFNEERKTYKTNYGKRELPEWNIDNIEIFFQGLSLQLPKHSYITIGFHDKDCDSLESEVCFDVDISTYLDKIQYALHKNIENLF